jgi:translation initiation factor 4A
LEGIQNFFIPLEKTEYKVDCILDLYKNLSITQAVIFCNRRQGVEMLGSEMLKYGFPVTCIHGELEKGDRALRMQEFLQGKTRVMIATDMLARGIDVQQVSLVINFDIPLSRESYIHRTGRAGRFGRKGTTINLILPEEEGTVKDISEHYGISIIPLPEDIRNIL